MWGRMILAAILPLLAEAAGYTTSNALAMLGFSSPTALAAPPGETNRLFVCERAGRILVITNLARPDLNVFLDMTGLVNGTQNTGEGGLLALAFHPSYAANGRFFVWYTAPSPAGVFSNRLSRFQVSATNANRASPVETGLLGQLDEAGNHNGADLKFGPDGHLYLALGDEGGGCDSHGNSQRINGDFFSAMIRIDVDKKPGSLAPNPHPAIVGATNYAIPPDNPYLGATQFNGLPVNPGSVRTEFFAVGLRNPWRFSFDPPSGLLYLNDVGQELREEVDLIVKGGNYGWRYREGTVSNSCGAASPPGFAGWRDPVLEYGHGQAMYQGDSIGGGHVYRGAKMPELSGRYVFNDFISGNIWSMTHDGSRATSFAWLTADSHIVYILPDPRDGELLLASLDGLIKKLARGPLPQPRPLNDFDGDGRSDIATYVPSDGNWAIIQSSNGAPRIRNWGWSQALPVAADYDGDGRCDLATYVPAEGNWYIAQSGSNGALRLAQWGWSRAIPVPADYDGDGRADLATYVPLSGQWSILQSRNGLGVFRQWGWSQAIPVAADYDGDGRADLATYVPASGQWAVNLSSTGQGLFANWGWSQAMPVPADYDGDGRTDIATYVPAEGTWYVSQSSFGGTLRKTQWGWSEAAPVPADYDGDGRADLATYHPPAGAWIVLKSGGGVKQQPWGWSQAVPVMPQFQVNRRYFPAP